MAVLLKSIYKSSAFSIQIPGQFFIDIEKKILKYIWKDRRPRMIKTILNILTAADVTTHTGHKQIHRPMRWNREPRCNYIQLHLFDVWQRYQEYILKKKKKTALDKWSREKGLPTCRKIKSELSLLSCPKLNSKWIKGPQLKTAYFRTAKRQRKYISTYRHRQDLSEQDANSARNTAHDLEMGSHETNRQ